MFARACAVKTAMAASAALALATTVYGLSCPTVGETLPAGIYVASANGELWRVNPRKGTGVAEAKLVGDLANPAANFYPTDIAFNDDGSLYGVDGFELFCIDPVNGESFLIGGGEFNPPWQTSLAGKTGSLGQLYGAGEDQLVAISVGSGKGTPMPTDYGPLACGTETGDLVFDLEQDILYGTVDCVGGGLADRSHLVTIDPATGKVLTNIGPIIDTTGTPRYGVFGLAFGPDGQLYAGTDVSLLKLDIGSGSSMEDFVILSQTPGETFDRVDGMASRVCEAPPYDADRGRRRTAGQWRQECRSGLDVDLAKFADPIIAYVTDGVVTTACEALHHTQPAPVMAGFSGDGQDGAKTALVQSGLRRTVRGRDMQPKAAGGPGGGDAGMSTLCGLGLRELAAAALNVGSGRVNHACASCDDGPSGRYLMELAETLQDAILADDDQTCNEVKREAKHLTGVDCD